MEDLPPLDLILDEIAVPETPSGGCVLRYTTPIAARTADMLDIVPTQEGGVAYIDANGLYWLNGVFAPRGPNLAVLGRELVAARLSPSGLCAVFFFVVRGGDGDGLVDAELVTPTTVWAFETDLTEENLSDLSYNIVANDGTVAYLIPFSCDVVITDPVTRRWDLIEIVPEDQRGDPDDDDHVRMMHFNIDPTSTRECIRCVAALEGGGVARGTVLNGDERVVVLTFTLQEDGTRTMALADLSVPFGTGDVDNVYLHTEISPRGVAMGGAAVDGVEGNVRVFDPAGRCVLHLAPGETDFCMGCVFLDDELMAVWTRSRLMVRTMRTIVYDEPIPEGCEVVANGRYMLVLPENALPRLYALPPCSRRDMMRTAILCARRLQSLQRMRYVNEDIWVYIFNTFFA